MAIKCILENNVHILLCLSPQFALCFLWSYDGQRKRVFTIVVRLVSFPDVLGSTTRGEWKEMSENIHWHYTPKHLIGECLRACSDLSNRFSTVKITTVVCQIKRLPKHRASNVHISISKHNLRGITLVRGPIRGIHSLTLIFSWLNIIHQIFSFARDWFKLVMRLNNPQIKLEWYHGPNF